MRRRKRATGLLPFAAEAMRQPRDLTPRAGLTLVAETLLALRLDEVVAQRLRVQRRQRGSNDFDRLQAVVLLLSAGGERVEDIDHLGGDAGLVRLLGRPLPSSDTLHRFLRSFHVDAQHAQRPAKGAWIPTESDHLAGLHSVNAELVRRATAVRRPRRATLDLDATVIESHKRDAKAHYKGGRGYQPTAVLWAEEDLVVADQYRDGNVPAAMDTSSVARAAFSALPAFVEERRFRGDSACYDERLLKWLAREKIAFSISADMSKELRGACSASSLRWRVFEDRVTEVVALSEVEFTPGHWPKRAAPLRYVALRFSGKQGYLFSDGSDTKYLAVVSNRCELSAAELVRWHWEKAGTIEQLHDVTKNELAARLPPSGRFGANAAWYRLSLLTFNVLTVLKRAALDERYRRARPKRLRYEVFAIAAELTQHARQLTARMAAADLDVEQLLDARTRLVRFRDQLDTLLSDETSA
jgi:hypothetical protein